MKDNEKELLFGKRLAELKRIAAENDKTISRPQVEVLFGDLELKASQMDMVYDYIKKQGISLVDKEESPLILSGSPESLSAAIDAFLPNIPDIARLYKDQGVLTEDLIGEGNLAVFEAAGHLAGGPCSPRETKEFESFMAREVMDAMERAVNETRALKDIENQVLTRVKRVGEAASELSDLLRRKVTVDELLKENEDMTEEEIRVAIKLAGGSLDVE